MENPVKKSEAWNGIDPVCGMEVSEENQYRFDFAGIEYHFCSEHCEKKFVADPSHYLGGTGMGQKNEHGHEHGERCHSSRPSPKDNVESAATGAFFT